MSIQSRGIIVLLIILSLIFLSCASSKKPPAARLQGEPAPTFQAKDILTPDIRKGKNYTIADKVAVDQYYYGFTIQSDFGEIPAMGTEVLELRLRELHAIEEAKRRTNKPDIVDGVLAPIKQTGKGLELLFSDPVNSIKNLPKGIEMKINQYANAADRRAGSALRRKLAAELDCDPETANPILKKLLDELSSDADAGSTLIEVAMAFVPGLSTLSMTANTKDLIAKLPPSQINKQIDQELESMGVDEYLRTSFIESPVYTTLQRLLFMEQYRKLKGIPNLSAMVDKAADARQESEALGFIRITRLFAELHQKHSITELDAISRIPLGVLGNGQHVMMIPADYLLHTQEVANWISNYRKKYPSQDTVCVVTGRVSQKARELMTLAAITIKENADLVW